MSINRTIFCFLLLLVGFARDANASYFEFCRLEGQIKRIPKPKDDGLWFVIKVKSSTPATCGDNQSDNPEVCRSYVGKSIKLGLPLKSVPKYGKGNSIVVIQRVFFSEVGTNPGYRVQWQLPGSCN